jgi:hypothetical protein
MLPEKDRLEIGALTQFSLALENELGVGRFLFKELRKPPEPDGLCSLDGSPLHVEVGHVYGTQSDVKQLLGRTGKSAASQDQKSLSAMVPLDTRLLVPLNKLLAEKATKIYSASPVWLLIRSAFPLWEQDDFMTHRSNILVPEAHPFEQIWLLCGAQASAGVLRLA